MLEFLASLCETLDSIRSNRKKCNCIFGFVTLNVRDWFLLSLIGL